MRPNWPLIVRQIQAAVPCEVDEIAAHCGCSKYAVQQWREGVKSPSFAFGWELLNAYTAQVSRKIPQL